MSVTRRVDKSPNIGCEVMLTVASVGSTAGLAFRLLLTGCASAAVLNSRSVNVFVASCTYLEMLGRIRFKLTFNVTERRYDSPLAYIGYLHYGMTSASQSDYALPAKFPRVKKPALRVLILDTYWANKDDHSDPGETYAPGSTTITGTHMANAWGKGISRRRHQGMTNTVFIDGHARAVPMGEINAHCGRSFQTDNMIWYKE